MDVASSPEALPWLVIAYTLPAEPSRKRVLVWRHLRKLGAIYLDSGFWFVPAQPGTADGVAAVLREIEEMDGQGHAFSAASLGETQDEALRAVFNKLRRDEYIDLLEKCERFLAHVQRFSQAGEFRFSDVEELEEDLEKRRRWLAQIVGRDAFGNPERADVEACLDRCEEALATYVEQAYNAAE